MRLSRKDQTETCDRHQFIRRAYIYIYQAARHPQTENCKDFEFYRITVVNNVNLYILPPEEGHENDQHYLKLMQEKRFMEEYFAQTGM